MANISASNPQALTAPQILNAPNQAILFALHRTPQSAEDSGWFFWHGTETMQNIQSNAIACALDDMIDMDTSLLDILDSPENTAWARDAAGAPWHELKDYQ